MQNLLEYFIVAVLHPLAKKVIYQTQFKIQLLDNFSHAYDNSTKSNNKTSLSALKSSLFSLENELRSTLLKLMIIDHNSDPSLSTVSFDDCEWRLMVTTIPCTNDDGSSNNRQLYEGT